MSNISKAAGRINEITTMSKIKFGRTEFLRLLLSNSDELTARVLKDIETIHYACWVVVTLEHGSYLMFISNYSGSFEKYIDDFASVLGLAVGLDIIWSNCEGWPGIGSVEVLKDFIRATTVGADLYYAACPEATVRDVLHGLHATEVVQEFLSLA
jgi:hypothetical protein